MGYKFPVIRFGRQGLGTFREGLRGSGAGPEPLLEGVNGRKGKKAVAVHALPVIACRQIGPKIRVTVADMALRLVFKHKRPFIRRVGGNEPVAIPIEEHDLPGAVR